MALATVFVSLSLLAGLQAFPQPPPPSCSRACAWCERAVQPVLERISQRCPLCPCAARNTTCPAPQPPARFCLQGVAKGPRGCSSERCRPAPGIQNLRSMLHDCPKSCPGGFRLNATTGQPMCECVCPQERLPPMQRTQRCAQTCRGFSFTTLFNPRSGCSECFCGKQLPVPNCLPFACPLHCPLGYELGPKGCPECRCKEPKGCPPAPACESTCLVGPKRDPFTGCITSCDCEDQQEFKCTRVACNTDCGPHKYEPVLRNNCLVACKCKCKEVTCPQDNGRFCIEPELDMFGCATCRCKRYENQRPQNIQICRPPAMEGPITCDVQCPSGLRPFDSEANCELCDCCPDLDTTCPNLQCKTYATNRFGCPICSCVPEDQPDRFAPPAQLPVPNIQRPILENEIEDVITNQRKPVVQTVEEVLPANIAAPYHPMKPEVPPELFEHDDSKTIDSIEDLSNHKPNVHITDPENINSVGKNHPSELEQPSEALRHVPRQNPLPIHDGKPPTEHQILPHDANELEPSPNEPESQVIELTKPDEEPRLHMHPQA